MKKLIIGVLLILLHCGSAISGVNGVAQLFCSGSPESDVHSSNYRGTCYNAEWLKTVISGEIPQAQLPKNITILNYNAVLIVRTDPAADTLRYTIKGLPDYAVTIRKNADTLTITEKEIRPPNRQTGNDWDRIIADIEVIIPSSAALRTVSIQSVIADTELFSLSSETLILEADISRIKVSDARCNTFTVRGGVAPFKLKRISCSTCDIRTSTADTFIENFTVTDKAVFRTSTGGMRIINGQLKDPSLFLTGSFDFTGSMNGDIRLDSGIGTIALDLQQSNAIGRFDIYGSTGDIHLKNFSTDALTLRLSTGSTRVEQAAIGAANISASTGLLDCDNCIVNDARITLSTGSFDFSGVLSGDTRIHRSTGSIDLNIHAPQDTYHVSFNGADYDSSSDIPSGTIIINKKAAFIGGNRNAENTLRIEGGTGRCFIRFLE